MQPSTRNNLRRPPSGAVEHSLRKLEELVITVGQAQLNRLIPENQYSPFQRLRSIGRVIDNSELPPTGSLILDVGTGFGYGAVLLSSLGYRVVGVDSNKDRVERGNTLWNAVGQPLSESSDLISSADNGVSLIHSSVADIAPVVTSKFDAATCFFLSGYMLEAGGALHQVAEHLKLGAPFFASTEGDIALPPLERDSNVQELANAFREGRMSLRGLDFREYYRIAEEVVYDPHVFSFRCAV